VEPDRERAYQERERAYQEREQAYQRRIAELEKKVEELTAQVARLLKNSSNSSKPLIGNLIRRRRGVRGEGEVKRVHRWC